MTEKYLVGMYLRLSKEDEKKGESTSISNQRDIIYKYLEANNLMLVDEYIDDGVSGTMFDNRKGWNNLIKDIENKKINMVITKDLSRFGRNEAHQLKYIDYFEELQIRYVSILDNIDTADKTNVSNEMMSINMFFNEKHVRDTSKKMKASILIKRQNGNFLGTYPPYGYKKDENNKYKLIIDEQSSIIVRRIFKLFVEGFSINKICQILTEEKIPIPSVYNNYKRGNISTLYGKWGNRTVSDILKLPTYVGDLTQGRSKKLSYKTKKRIHTKEEEWIICKNSCPAIIDRTTFQLAKNLHQKNKYQNINNNDFLLKGLVYCKECKHKISFRKHKSSNKLKKEVIRIYGNCNYWAKNKYLKPCTPHNVKYLELEKIITEEIKKICKNNIKKDNLIKTLEKATKQKFENENLECDKLNLIQQNKNIEYKINKIYEDRLDNLINKETYVKLKIKLEEEYKKNEQEINKLEKYIDLNKEIKYPDYEKIINNFFNKNPKFYQLIHSIIDKIEIDENKKIDIYYKIKKLN